jgi:predicted protein tyrosine phosphatase
LPNLLFICGKNQWRSPTAELLFKNHTIHSVRSAGTSDKARIKVNQQLIAWADIILVMERKHRRIVEQNFTESIEDKPIIILDIEDIDQFNDPELIDILRISLQDYL